MYDTEAPARGHSGQISPARPMGKVAKLTKRNSSDSSDSRVSGSMSVDELTLDPSNVRLHDKRNLETIKGSLQRFGQQKPIVVGSDGVVIASNGTLAAARELGWETIRVIHSELEGAERTAYAIADNRSAALAEWDDSALAEQLSALAIDDEALRDAAGFSAAELDALVGAAVFAPGTEDEQSDLDQLGLVTCPECGHEFQK